MGPGLACLTGSGAVTSSWDSWEGDSPALLPCQIYPLGLKGENIWEKIGHIEGKKSGSYGPFYNVHVSRGAPESSWQRPLRGRWPWPGRCQIFGVTRLHARMTPRRNAATATQQETESSPFPSSQAGSAPSPTQAASSEVALHTPVGTQRPPALGLPPTGSTLGTLPSAPVHSPPRAGRGTSLHGASADRLRYTGTPPSAEGQSDAPRSAAAEMHTPPRFSGDLPQKLSLRGRMLNREARPSPNPAQGRHPQSRLSSEQSQGAAPGLGLLGTSL